MWSLICLYLLVAAAGQVYGIEFYLSSVNKGDICGKLRCIEETSKEDNIKNITIRKVLKSDVVLLAKGREEPSWFCTFGSYDRYTKGSVADGNMTAHTAVVEIDLYFSNDCNNAGFVCEVVRFNKFGEEVVSSSARRIKPYPPVNYTSKRSLSVTTCPRGQKPSLDNRYQVVYPIYGGPISLCDTDGGWTVIQRRLNGKINFFRDWASYKRGFGTFEGEFWYGLENIHRITSQGNYELMVTMMYRIKYYAHYYKFKVSGEEDNYRLSIGAYVGTAGDSLRFSDNMMFSTFDRDNDITGGSCAESWQGGWWYSACYEANLNGNWTGGGDVRPMWFGISRYEPVTMSELKIRKLRNCFQKHFDCAK